MVGAAAAMLVVFGSSVGGQEVQDLLALNTQGRELQVGTEVAGALSEQDAQWSDGTPIQAWALRLERGQGATVDLLSDDFDAFLLVGGPGMTDLLVDDDGAGACDSRVQFVAESAGIYHVGVNSVQGSVGNFRLRVTMNPGPLTEGPCGGGDDPSNFTDEQVTWLRALPTGGRTFSVDTEVPGSLGAIDSVSWDGSYVQAWTLTMRRPGSVYVDLISDDFDAFLFVFRDDRGAPLFDDDGAGSCHSRVAMEEVPAGDYLVIANSVGPDAIGRFRLRASADPLPPIDDPCESELSEWIRELPTDDRVITLENEHSGSLTPTSRLGGDGTYAAAWSLTISSPLAVTVDLMSDDFDSFLFVILPTGEIVSDDDSGGACHARVVIENPTPGVHRVIANTTLPDEVGAYRFRAGGTPGPVAQAECAGAPDAN